MATKFFAENQAVSGSLIKDKDFILTKTNGSDFKVSYNALYTQMYNDMLKQMFAETMVGSIYINTNNKYRDNKSIMRGQFEYLLCQGDSFNVKDYPQLAAELNTYSSDKKTFTVPNFNGAYLKASSSGSGNALMRFVEGAVLKHNHHHEHLHNVSDHTHGIDDIQGKLEGKFGDDMFVFSHNTITDGCFTRVNTPSNFYLPNPSSQKWGSSYIVFSSHAAGVKATQNAGGGTTNGVTVNTDPNKGRLSSEYTENTGAEENDCNRVYVQYYICAGFKDVASAKLYALR